MTPLVERAPPLQAERLTYDKGPSTPSSSSQLMAALVFGSLKHFLVGFFTFSMKTAVWLHGLQDLILHSKEHQLDQRTKTPVGQING